MKGTDEDDDLEIEQLLAEQDRFLQSRQKASAKVVRVQPPTTDAKPAPSMPSTPIPEIERDVVQLSNVFERDPSLPIQPPKPRSRPFPEVVQLSMEEMRSREQAKKENKKSSLFTKMRQENPSQPPMGSAPIGNIPPPPPVKATLREVSTWRFDFGGRIVTEDVPTHMGLHHHGEQPTSAGYSLQEIIILVQSSVPSQRTIMLQSLNAVITKLLYTQDYGAERNHLWEYLQVLHFLPVLRAAIDDEYHSAAMAALLLTHTLLIEDKEEDWWEECDGLYDGYVTLPMSPLSHSEIVAQKDENIDIEHNAERDLLGYFIQTDTIERLKLFLSEQYPNSASVILALLIKLMRYSPEPAIRLTTDSEFLEHLLSRFLESSSLDTEPEDGQAVLHVIRLVRLCIITDKRRIYELNSGVQILLALRSFVSGITPSMGTWAHLVAMETLKTFRVLGAYGQLFQDEEDASEVLPDLAKYVQDGTQNLSKMTDIQLHTLSCIAMMSMEMARDAKGTIVSAYLSSIVQQYAFLLGNAIHHWETGTLSSSPLKKPIQHLMGCIFHFLATYVTTPFPQLPQHIPTIRQILESYTNSRFAKDIQAHTCLSLAYPTNSIEVVRGLPSIPFINDANKDQYVEVKDSQNVMMGWMRLVTSMARGNNSFITPVNDVCLVVLGHLNSWCRSLQFAEDEVPDLFRHFLRTETLLRYHIIKHLSRQDLVKSQVWSVYESALDIMAMFLPGDEFYVNDLLRNVICQPDVVSAVGGVGMSPQRCEMLHTFFLRYLAKEDSTRRHAVTTIELPSGSSRGSLMLEEGVGMLPFPRDWVGIPIRVLYESLLREDPAPPGLALQLVQAQLEFLLLLETGQSKYIKEIVLCRKVWVLMQVFTIGSSLFLDPEIKSCLAGLVRVYFNDPRPLGDFAEISEINFFNFFLEFVTEFGSNSFGDENFSACVLLFLRRKEDVIFRKTIWTDLQHLLHLLHPPSYYPQLEEYLYPLETDVDLLKLYLNSMLEGRESSVSSLGYLIPLHHVAMFIFDADRRDYDWIKTQFLTDILCKEEKLEVIRDVLLYVPGSSGTVSASTAFHSLSTRPDKVAQVVGSNSQLGEVVKSVIPEVKV